MADILGGLLGGLGAGGIGAAVVRLSLDSSSYNRELNAAHAQTSTSANAMSGGLAKFSGVAKAGLAGVAVGLAAFGVAAVRAAADLGESLNKAEVVFGSASQSVIAFSETSATKFGIAQSAALEAAAGFGAMAQSAGLTADASADMSIELVKLAADMASLNNADPSEMLEKLRGGLAGEAEPLRKFGVFISEARVETEAFASGIAQVGDELTDAQKIQARYNIILQDTTKAQGDFARTSESLPNQLRIMKAEFTDLAAEAGQRLVPAVTEFVGVIRDLLPVLLPVIDILVDMVGVLGDLAQAFTFSDTGIANHAAQAEILFGKYKSGAISILELEDSLIALRNETGLSTQYSEAHQAALDQAQDAALRMEQAMYEAAGAVDEEAEAAARAAEASRELLSAQLALTDASFGVVEAVRADTEAEGELAAARSRLERLSASGREGTRAWREAQDEYSDAVLNAATSHSSLIGSILRLREEVEDGTRSQRSAITSLREMGKQAGLSAPEIQRLVDELREGVGAAREFGQAGQEGGEAFAAGLIAAINSQAQQIYQAAYEAAAKAELGARAALQAESPSRVGRRIGVDFITGIAQGLESEDEALIKAATEAIEAMTKAVQRELDEMTRAFEKQISKLEGQLSRVQSRASDLRGAVTGGFSSFSDISGAFDAETLTAAGGIGGFFASQVSGAQQFAAVLNALQAQGASAGLLSQIAEGGPEAIPFAQSLLQQGPGAIAGVNAAIQTIADLAGTTAKGLSEAFFGERIDDLRDHLKDVRTELREQTRMFELMLRLLDNPERLLRRLEEIRDVIGNITVEVDGQALGNSVHSELVRRNRRSGSLQLT